MEWACGPFFICVKKMKEDNQLTSLVRNVVEPMGYELVGCELVSGDRQGTVFRVYIDHENGITLDDCSSVSHQLSGVLDVEDPIRGNYNLEISSPGLDRPLFTPAHYQRFSGETVSLRMRLPQDGRKKFKGTLLGCEQGVVSVLVEGSEYRLPFDQVEQARLVPEI